MPRITQAYLDGTSRAGRRHARMRAAMSAEPVPANAPAAPPGDGNTLFAEACQNPTDDVRWKILADWVQDHGGAMLQYTHQQWLSVKTVGDKYHVSVRGSVRAGITGDRLWVALRWLAVHG